MRRGACGTAPARITKWGISCHQIWNERRVARPFAVELQASYTSALLEGWGFDFPLPLVSPDQTLVPSNPAKERAPATMKILRRLQLVVAVALMFGVGAAGKCPTGTATIHGRVDGLLSDTAPAEMVVVLETPRGNVSKTSSITNGEFTVEISFSTLSSSFLGGDKCHNTPKVAEVRVTAAGKTYFERRMQFNDNFEIYGPFLFRLKQNLSIEIPKEAGNMTGSRPFEFAGRAIDFLLARCQRIRAFSGTEQAR